jgi:hypothetical protein
VAGLHIRFLSHNSLKAKGGAALFVTSVGNLKTARPLALDNDLAVERAQFDLPNVTASDVNLFRDQRCALQAATGLALRNVLAAMYHNRSRCGIEVWLEHK